MTTGTGLAALLTLEQSDEKTWIGRTHGVALPHVFGGQLVAQSLVAAGRAHPPDMPVHSIHTAFLRAGNPLLPVAFHVRVLRSGRLVSTVEVEGRQGERVLCHSVVSCTRQTGGITHARPGPVYANPQDSVDLHEIAGESGGLGEYWADFGAIAIRLAPIDESARAPHSASPPRGIWMRVAEGLPDDPLVHQGAMAYASDLMLMSTAVTPHGHRSGEERDLAARWDAVSLDHAIWFRRPVRADDWMLFEHTTPMAEDSRALIEVAVFDGAGEMVGQIMQEALIRSRKPVLL